MILRVLSVTVLTLALVASAVAVSGARGLVAGDGVICGQGMVRVVIAADGLPLLDDSGAPVDRGPPCLDCILGAALPVLLPALPGIAGASSKLRAAERGLPTPQVWRMGGKGRSPPGVA